MKRETLQQSLFLYKTNALSTYSTRSRGHFHHFRSLSVVAALIVGIGYLVLY